MTGLIDEHGIQDVSYQAVRGYVAERKPGRLVHADLLIALLAVELDTRWACRGDRERIRP